MGGKRHLETKMAGRVQRIYKKYMDTCAERCAENETRAKVPMEKWVPKMSQVHAAGCTDIVTALF